MKFINTFFAIVLISSLPIESAEENFIGDVNLGEVTHSDAFNFIKDNMLGKWEGKLTQHSGNVIEASYHFKLVSNGNTIREELIEDGVEMFTTYSDKDGELVIKHYCALGTEPMFTVDNLTESSVAFKSDPTPGYHSQHHNFVNAISWEKDKSSKDTIIMNNSIYVDGEIENNQAVISRVY